LANRAIIGRILHTNRKGWIYGLFKRGSGILEKIGARIGVISLVLSVVVVRFGGETALWKKS
jgi:energy-converting hydrogenase Eha subunit G